MRREVLVRSGRSGAGLVGAALEACHSSHVCRHAIRAMPPGGPHAPHVSVSCARPRPCLPHRQAAGGGRRRGEQGRAEAATRDMHLHVVGLVCHAHVELCRLKPRGYDQESVSAPGMLDASLPCPTRLRNACAHTAHGWRQRRHLCASHVHRRRALGIRALDARSHVLLLAQGAQQLPSRFLNPARTPRGAAL